MNQLAARTMIFLKLLRTEEGTMFDRAVVSIEDSLCEASSQRVAVRCFYLQVSEKQAYGWRRCQLSHWLLTGMGIETGI